MSEVTARYGDVDLSQYWEHITDIRRDIGNDDELVTEDTPFLGETLIRVNTKGKEIEVDFTIWSKYRNQVKHALAKVFRVNEPQKLVFSDEPDRYYLAIKSGKIEMRESELYRSTGTITFFVPDGVAHSTTYKEYTTPTSTSGNKLTFDVVNNGSENALPIIEITNNVENGYIGIVNSEGALEIGNREEADTAQKKKSELLFDYRDNKIMDGFDNGSKNVAILNDKSQSLDKSLAVQGVWGRPHLLLVTRGTSGNHAGSLSWTIPEDSNGDIGSLNDYLWWRQIFWLGRGDQYGFIKVSVSDENGDFLYGVETIKRAYGLSCEYNIMVTDGSGGYKIIDRFTFKGTHENKVNPFNKDRGFSCLIRNNDKLSYYWFGTTPSKTVPELKGKKSAKVHIALGSIGKAPLVTHMYIDSIFYRKDNVSYVEDVPNRYPSQSKITISSESNSITVDNMNRIEDFVYGSKFPEIPPGESTLEFYSSSWVDEPPTILLKFEERNL